MTRAKGITGRESGPQQSRNFAVAYLNVLIDDGGEEELTAALGRIARASGGPKLVEKVELNSPSFYRTLCRRGNPELKSVATLLKAMGIRLALLPLGDKPGAPQPARVRRPRYADPMKFDEEGACL
jgi:probable addiction module antidote protein